MSYFSVYNTPILNRLGHKFQNFLAVEEKKKIKKLRCCVFVALSLLVIWNTLFECKIAVLDFFLV